MRATCAIILVIVCLPAARAAETPVELNVRATALFRQGKYREAEKLYRTAMATYKEASQLNVSGYAATINNLAGTLQTEGRIDEAKRLLEEVVSLDAKITDDFFVVTHALSNLALIHQAAREFPKAMSLLQRALHRAMPESAIGNRTRAGTLHNLGAVYFDMGQYKKAAELFEESLRIHTLAGAVEQTPATLTFLARLKAKTGDVTQASKLLDRALDLRRQIHGPLHPLVAVGYSDIAEFHKENGRYDESAALFEQALEVMEASVGRDHLYAAPVLYHYGETRRLQGRHEEALVLYRSSIDILERTFGAGHSRLAIVYKSAALSAGKLKLKQEAKKYDAQARTLESAAIDYRGNSIDVSAFTAKR